MRPASMPGTGPRFSSVMRRSRNLRATGPKSTVAFVWMLVGACPFCDNAADRAIEKHALRRGDQLSGLCRGRRETRVYEYLPRKRRYRA